VSHVNVHPRILLAALALALIVPLTGCGGQEGPERIQVRGQVTYGGGPWPKPGVLYFVPIENAPGNTHPGLGYFDTSGSFRAQTFGPGDGLVPGTYRVRVECWEVEPSPDPKHGPPKSYVPANHTLPDLEIPAGTSGPLTPSYDVPKR
jgi:hypothetical protein